MITVRSPSSTAWTPFPRLGPHGDFTCFSTDHRSDLTTSSHTKSTGGLQTGCFLDSLSLTLGPFASTSPVSTLLSPVHIRHSPADLRRLKPAQLLISQMAQPPPPLIKPSSVDRLPHLTPEQKNQWKTGLAQLWDRLEKNPPESQTYLEAEAKIRHASMKIMQQLQNRSRPPSCGGNGAASGSRPNPSQYPGDAQPMVAPGMQSQRSQGTQPSTQGHWNVTETMPPDAQSIDINVPLATAQQGERAVKHYRANASMQKQRDILLVRREKWTNRGRMLQEEWKSYQQANQTFPSELLDEFNNCKQEVSALNAELDKIMKQNNNVVHSTQRVPAQGMHRQQSEGSVQANGTAEPQLTFQQSLSQQNPAAQAPSGALHGDTRANPDTQSASPPQLPRQQPLRNSPLPSPSLPTSRNVMHHNQSRSHPPLTSQSSVQSLSHPDAAQQSSLSQYSTQQSRVMTPHQTHTQEQPQHQRPKQPISAAQPNAAQSQVAMQPQQQPRALTHQAAIQQVAATYQPGNGQPQSQQQSLQQQNPNHHLPNGGNVGASGASFPHGTNSTYAQPPPNSGTQQSSSNTKFPIPKQLQMDPRTQNPVAGPPARPTYGNAGMLSQPGVQRPAQFTLEGKGNHVLSKSKLDSLVREVTGTPTSLAPETAEAVLTLTDDFVDTVIRSACRLAKFRGAQALEVRDIEVVLERDHGIRIPGHAVEEGRTVKKSTPTTGWQVKMQAVQAAKVMGSSAAKDKEN